MVGFEPLDTFQDINKLTRKFLNYKFFLNSEEKIALSIIEENAGISLAPNDDFEAPIRIILFTLNRQL